MFGPKWRNKAAMVTCPLDKLLIKEVTIRLQKSRSSDRLFITKLKL